MKFTPLGFLKTTVTNRKVLSFLNDRGLQEYIRMHDAPAGSVFFYSLLLDALLAMNTKVSSVVKMQILCTRVFATHTELSALRVRKIQLPNQARDCFYCEHEATASFLEVLISLGGIVVKEELTEQLKDLDPMTENKLLVRGIRNCRLRMMLPPYCLDNFVKLTANPNTSFNNSADPLQSWIKNNFVGKINEGDAEYLKSILSKTLASNPPK